MAEESRAFADPVTRSLIAPVRVGSDYLEALARIRELGVTAAEAASGWSDIARFVGEDTPDAKS